MSQPVMPLALSSNTPGRQAHFGDSAVPGRATRGRRTPCGAASGVPGLLCGRRYFGNDPIRGGYGV
jgi:hypothetical protein